ncbi:MAG: hypothetical protein N2167_01410 [Flavobacteriales bacterium]|nr:hypothetical protein [Flavobacteriales bacterium]
MSFVKNYWVYLLTACVIATGCGSPSRQVDQTPELDTLAYHQYIINGPDSSVYPLLQHVSSQREPISDFGLQQMFDGNLSTSWQSEPGLHAGEWLTFQFQSLPISKIVIHVSDTFLVARVNQIEVWINDTLQGLFPTKTTITYKGILKKLTIRAVDADGLNLVDIPTIQDTTKLERIAYRQLSSYYNSKSFAISEIEFFNYQGKKISVQPIPYRMAKINTWDHIQPSVIADGDLTTGWSNIYLKEHRINIAFNEFTPVTRVKLFNGIEKNNKIKGIQKCILSLTGRPEAQWTLKPGWNDYQLPLPMVGKMFTLRMVSTQPMGLAELFFYDGAKYYQPYSDSLRVHIQQLKDMLSKTSLQPAINNRLYFKERIVILKSDTVSNKNYKDLPISQLQGARTSSYDLILRANQTIELKSELIKEIYGKEIRIILENRLLTGRWFIKSKDNKGDVIIQVKGILEISRTESGNTNRIVNEDFSAIFKASSNFLILGDLGEMMISY